MENTVPFLTEIVTPKPKTYYFAGGDVFYSHELQEKMKPRMASEGIQEAGATFSNLDASDFTSVILDIKQKNPDVVLISIDSDSGITFAKQYSDMRVAAPALGISGKFIYQDIIAPMSDKGNYLSFMGFTWNAPLSPKTQPFYQKYTARFGHQPVGYEDVRAYDGLFLYKDAIDRAGSLDVNAVVSSMEQARYVGVAGEYTFSQSHQATIPGLLGQWMNGEATLLWPKQIATGDFKRAPWWKQ
jgi:branched-chain amino acid transport system substrate-binding protein